MARTILGKGQSITIGEGTNDIFGTAAGAERVTIRDDTIATFGSNFNAGGDTIRLAGTATDFTIRQAGSFAILKSVDDGIVVNIPIGSVGITIAFETAPGVYGDSRNLVYNGTNTVIDGQIVTATETALNPDAPPAGPAVPAAGPAIDSTAGDELAAAKAALAAPDVPAFAAFGESHTATTDAIVEQISHSFSARSGAESGLMNFIVNFA